MSTEKQKHLCPVCGKYEFKEIGSFDDCPVCGWEDDSYQEWYPDEDCCGNQMSLNEAREAYKMGISEDDAVDVKYAAGTPAAFAIPSHK